MKKNLFFIALSLGASILTFGQSNTFPPSGNVGIGVTDPKTKLEIDGDISARGWDTNYSIGFDTFESFNFNSKNVANYGLTRVNNSIALSGWDRLTFFTKGKPEITLNESGNVGIGVTDPKTKLDVDGTISLRGWDTNYSIGFDTYDAFDYKNQKVANYGLTRVGNEVVLAGWEKLNFSSNFKIQMALDKQGRLGIGTENPDEKLTVKGKIHAEEVIVDLNVPADYVFQKYYTGKSDLKADYVFPKLNEIESFVKENNHLPDMPSAKEIQENGLKIGEMNNLLLQKIEELTLLLIEQNKINQEQQEQLIILKQEVNQLKQK
ncbi:hypothetical protein [Chishuiella sp.]|uniref:hypothetical protein n=1 Tax=Chishuiella sp. TaxID=1969467 RepID=UPI0028A9DCA2|nr:hypothetical protein [Chishuiella sp.]